MSKKVREQDIIKNLAETHQSVKDEYNHVIERSNKLEFKISILVAVIGVILSTVLYHKVPEINVDICISLSVILKVLYALIIALLIIVLVLFLYLLISTRLQRINNKELLSRHLDVVSKDIKTYYYFVDTKYINYTTINNEIISKKFAIYDFILKLMILVVILLLFYNILDIIWR